VNTYRPVSARAKAIHGEEPFEAEFSVVDERDHINGGHLAIEPRSYKVLSANYGPGQGKTFDGAFPIELEAALISGGHIERVEKPVKSTTKKGDA
jgi:hypothetical protein